MSHPSSAARAPWKLAFAQHLEEAGHGSSVEFSLATVTERGFPRVRTLVHRGFWATFSKQTYSTVPTNPRIYETDCPFFTTSAHLSKVSEILSSSKTASKEGNFKYSQRKSGTGGGGPVEAVYWLKEVKKQWRIRGTCWLISADDVEDHRNGQDVETLDASDPVKMMKAAVGNYMRHRPTVEDRGKALPQYDQSTEWNWRREVEVCYHNLTPVEQGTFERNNFRVAIILPEAVELRDVSDPAVSNKQFWALSDAGAPSGSGGAEKRFTPFRSWESVKTWPT